MSATGKSSLVRGLVAFGQKGVDTDDGCASRCCGGRRSNALRRAATAELRTTAPLADVVPEG